LILVAGASGALGSTAARQLLAAGCAVRALTRRPERLDGLAALGAEVVRGDLLDLESLARACEGVTQVFTTANSFLGGGASAPERVDVPGNRNLIAAAERAGVRHFVFTSALGIERFAAVDYFRAKLASERHLQASRVPWTILRPAAFMETWAMLLGVPVVTGTPVRIVGDGRRRANYVCLDDVAAMVCRVLDEPPAGAIIEFGGPDELTALEIVAIFETLSGRRARRQHAPAPVIRVIAGVLRPFNPVLARQLRLAVLAATTNEPRLDMTSVLSRYRIPQTRFEDWAARRIQSLTSTGRVARDRS
jgi:NADH dehydrogenase